MTINKLKLRISENANSVKRYNNCYMCFPKTRHDIRENPLSKVKAHWWIWNNWNKKSCIEQNQNEKQVSHKYYRLHEDRRRFELGLRFYRSSFSYQCRQKNRYQYANFKQRKLSQTICCSGKRQFVHHIEMQITKP